MAGQVAAVLEVYLILRLMGCQAGFLSALAIEGFTKLVNVIGMINPGNAGTYEGGNMLLAKLAGMGGTAGLTLGLIRRVRALFWAAVGAICAVMLPGTARREEAASLRTPRIRPEHGHTAIILAQGVPVDSILARVGALPVLLRAILGAQKAGARRIVVVVDHAEARRVQEELRRTQRLPDNVEWCETAAGEIAPILRDIAASEDRIVLIAADRTYHPSLHRRAAEWEGTRALGADHRRSAGGHLRFHHTPQAIDLLKRCPREPGRVEELHEWLTVGLTALFANPFPSDQWQRVSSPEDRLLAEQKLDQWLVKPTDGVLCENEPQGVDSDQPPTHQIPHYAEHGELVHAWRWFSGRRLLRARRPRKYVAGRHPIGFREHSGRLRRRGGAPDVAGLGIRLLVGNGLRLPVLRLHLRRDDDRAVGQRSGLHGLGHDALFWRGCQLSSRQRCRGAEWLAARPEQYLSLWQAQASRRRSNPFLYLGRHTEFLIRRCCMPYLFLAFALFGATYMAFIGAAVGANIVWPIALYSYFTFDPARTPHD